MVLSTTKRTSSISSIVNKNQGGGEKKAGLPYIVGRNHWYLFESSSQIVTRHANDPHVQCQHRSSYQR